MRNAIAILLFVAVTLIAACVGVFAPLGVCAAIWRRDTIATLIGPDADRGHPASWVFLALSVPSALVAIAGALAIYLSLLHFFPRLTPATHPAGQRLKSTLLRWERRCAVAWGRQARYELRQLEVSGESQGAAGRTPTA